MYTFGATGAGVASMPHVLLRGCTTSLGVRGAASRRNPDSGGNVIDTFIDEIRECHLFGLKRCISLSLTCSHVSCGDVSRVTARRKFDPIGAGMFSRVLRRVAAPVKARAQSSAAKQSQHARTIDDLRTPALCCYPSVMEANAKAMLDRASRLGCVLRPHVKTAKTLQAATMQTGGTKRRVVVSTVAEAEFLASGGFDDILYAVPITEDKFGAADELNQRLERFHVVVDHPRTVRALTSRAVTKPLSVVVMVDCGELTYFTVVSSNVSGLVSRDVAER